MEAREIIQLFDDVPGGGSTSETYTFEQDGTIERLWVRNYIGHEFDLKYYFEVESRGGRRRNLLEHQGKQFVTGDDDVQDFDLREEVEAGETLHIKAENDEGQYLYHANCYASVDYEKGVLGALKSLLPGVA